MLDKLDVFCSKVNNSQKQLHESQSTRKGDAKKDVSRFPSFHSITATTAIAATTATATADAADADADAAAAAVITTAAAPGLNATTTNTP